MSAADLRWCAWRAGAWALGWSLGAVRDATRLCRWPLDLGCRALDCVDAWRVRRQEAHGPTLRRYWWGLRHVERRAGRRIGRAEWREIEAGMRDRR